MDRALEWLQATQVAKAISENEILFPWIESVHVLAIVLVVGTISIVDLRLLGVASLDRAVSRLMHDVLPYTWGAFVIAVVLHVDLEIFAPKILTKPWKTTRIFFRQRARKFDIVEGVCAQGDLAERVNAEGDHVFVPVEKSAWGNTVAVPAK